MSQADEALELRRCVRDLVALSALPALWIGYPPWRILESVADALVGTLRLDLCYVRLPLPSDGTVAEVARTSSEFASPDQVRTLGVDLAPWLATAPPDQPARISTLAGSESLRIAVTSLGYEGSAGVVIAGSRRADFPTEQERLLFGVAANQAAIALQGARLYREARDAVHAREEFLSIAAHELRNPVAGIKGNAELLLRWHERGQLDGARLERLLATIVHGSDRLAALVEDLMDVSRLQGGQLSLAPQPTHLPALLRAVIARQQVTTESHQLHLEITTEQCEVLADPDRVEQVLTNLVSNAVKYSPDGGDVHLSVGEDEGGAIVRVRDHGIGLPEGATRDLFRPFGRASNAVERNLPGLGLGLYICRQIVERHGGRIWAESAGEGLGTTISVWLPAGGPDARGGHSRD
jgi:signal transduction histidine kinase